jgi:MscS family membrane protein
MAADPLSTSTKGATMTAILLILLLGAGDVGVCASPRDALRAWLDGLETGRDVAAATRCVVRPADMTTAEAREALVDLKRVADARGVYVRLDGAPDSPDWVDPRTQEARYVPNPLLPEIEVVRTQDGWALSPSTLRSARRLADETFVVDVRSLTRTLPKWMTRPVLGVAPWQLLAVVALAFLGGVVRLVVMFAVVAWLRRVVLRFGWGWSDDVLVPATKPLGLLLLAGTMALGLPMLGLPVWLSIVLTLAVRVLAASSVVLVAYRFVDVLAESLSRRAAGTDSRLDDQLVPLVRRALKVAIVAIGAVFVLQNLQIDVASLIAGLGLGGLAFALAAKDTISHLFGSITIFLDKPFQIGDWVNTCGVEGIVEEVGFRTTRVRTFYNSVVVIPNGKLTDAVIDNYGMRQFRRCSTTVSLTYATTPEQMEAFCAGVRGIIAAHPHTRKDLYEVHFSAFGDASLDVMLYFFFTVKTWSEELRARHEIFLDVHRLAERLGVEFAFPTQTLHIETLATSTSRSPRPPLPRPELERTVVGFGPGGGAVVPAGPRLAPSFLPGTPPPPPSPSSTT